VQKRCCTGAPENGLAGPAKGRAHARPLALLKKDYKDQSNAYGNVQDYDNKLHYEPLFINGDYFELKIIY